MKYREWTAFNLPGDNITPNGIPDYGPNQLTTTINSYEAGNLEEVNGLNRLCYDFNSGGASDADYITMAANSNITIGNNPFTFITWCNIASYGLGTFAEFGRIFYKGAGIDWRFDAATGPYGAGANVRLHLSRSTSGTTQVRAGGSNAEVPLNTNMMVALSHDGSLTSANVHIYTGFSEAFNEITYQVGTDGTGTFTDDSGTTLYMRDRSAGDRLCQGQFWGDHLIVGRALNFDELHDYYFCRDIPVRRTPGLAVIAAGGTTIPVFHHHYNQMRVA